ncbi:MAG TPA: bacillithiol biosynthesis BshC, partial [Holophagaceae bacterium]|nr:bacillithiol biosynthesis BshC [Holophagaceae bacterium]
LIVTGQQIGAGWSPALSVVKALAALVRAEQLGGTAVYWMADEDHDHLEVASVVGLEAGRLRRHRFSFGMPAGIATGWLPWTEAHQAEAEALWGPLPAPAEPTLKDHVRALGEPLWRRGLRPFSPTEPHRRHAIQPELERWRALNLEADLLRQAERLEAEGVRMVLDPRTQAAWFSLDPATGRRVRLEPGEALPAGAWLSPGAAVRPLMQSLLLPVTHAVLGPGERAYWRLCEPLWERVGIQAPVIVPRPRAFVVPRGLELAVDQLADVREARWSAFVQSAALPSLGLRMPQTSPLWSEALGKRVMDEYARFQQRVRRLDARFQRDQVKRAWGRDPEQVRQALFPFGKDQERILPGWFWLRDEALIDRMAAALGSGDDLVLVEEA